ncbi:hypothetical protein [Streptomyces sp. NPDC004286]|uniref:hypothetical protein n=1 Tax=Streptomyces sp. NPDC004286 TaxID=3364696 RepID=UPI0036BA08AB
MTAPPPQRHVDADRRLPPAMPVSFTQYAYAVQPEDVTRDMGSLADRIRQIAHLTAGEAMHLPLGGNFFDAVVTASSAETTSAISALDDIQRLGTDSWNACGPVIEDPERALLYWLVPPGTSERWQPHDYATCFGRPHRITLPPLARTKPPGIHWRRPCRADRLVPVAPLRDQLDRLQPPPVPHDALLGPGLAAQP